MAKILLGAFLLAKLAAASPPDLPPRSQALRFEIAAAKSTEIAKGGMAVLTEVFKKHGYTITFEYLPLQRSLFELKSGRLDGSAGRIAETAAILGLNDYERLEVPITYATLALWCHKDYGVRGKGRTIKLGYLRGSVKSVELIESTDKKRVTSLSLNGNKAGATMLFNRRIDCMMAFMGNFEDEINGEYDLSSYSRIPLMTHAYYPWIHKSLAPLKKLLEDDLRHFPFPKEWAEKYRSSQSLCKNQLDRLCPDGFIFK